MKKSLLLSLICIIALIGFNACEKEEVAETISYSEHIIEQFQNPSVTQKISEVIDLLNISYKKTGDILGLKSFEKDDFDFETLFSTKDLEGEGIIALYKFNTPQMRLSLVFVKSQDGFNTPLLVQTTNNKVVYLDLANNNSIQVNQKNSKLQFEAKQVVLKENDAVVLRTNCTGKAVLACLQDGYSNHGWTSLGLTILTAFAPETIAIAALACSLANC